MSGSENIGKKAKKSFKQIREESIRKSVEYFEHAKRLRMGGHFEEAALTFAQAADEMHHLRYSTNAFRSISGLMEQAGLCYKKTGSQKKAEYCFTVSTEYANRATRYQFTRNAIQMAAREERLRKDIATVTKHKGRASRSDPSNNQSNSTFNVRERIHTHRPAGEPTFMQWARYAMYPAARPVIDLEIASRMRTLPTAQA